jgi:ornithine cyclodeaminase/alanine dehydrogenase-like protein (mu-crystallin family)
MQDEISRQATPTLILDQRTIAALMTPRDYLDAVEAGFRSYAGGGGNVPLPMHLRAQHGAFHAKAARLKLDRDYVAVKLNANFPGNPAAGLPTIQGVVLLCDGDDGTLLAVMDSIEITLRRTAAATALAARLLAPDDAESITICGCGEQGRAQLAALAEVLPLRRAFAWDLDADKAAVFARDMSNALRLHVIAVTNPSDAARSSQIIVTATTARAPFLSKAMVPRGAFVAAVGADSPEKSELVPDLTAGATIVVDLLAQAVTMGDLHHAIDAGLVTAEEVHAELGDLIAGRRAGRTSPDETIVFDSTGTALQDVASAAWIWQRAVKEKVGFPFTFAAI